MLSLFVAIPLLASSPAAEAPFLELNFDQALAAAKKDGKVVMIDFFTTWCQPCKKLDKVTWADEGVRKWLGEKTVPLKIDAEKEAELAKRFAVEAYPTMVFVQPDGTKLDVIVGFKKPDEFLSLAKDALAGRTSSVRMKEKLEAARTGLAGHENNPMKRKAFAKDLAEAGMYDEALKEYLWCFDHGNDDPKHGFYGVRLSFLLGDLQQLGAKHPPAITALEERRDKAEALVLAGTDVEENAADMAALNGALGTREKSLAVYDRLKKEGRLGDSVKARLMREIAPLLVEAQRYKDLVEDGGDIEEQVRLEIGISRMKPRLPDNQDPEVVKAMEQVQAMIAYSKAQELGLWYEALLGAGKLESAAKVADEIVGFVPKAGIYSSLVDRALRAGAPDAARELVEHGRKALPDEEKKDLERAAKRIPSK